MAFTDRRPDTNRVAKIIAVSAFQATVIYALVAGLKVEFEKPDIWVLPTGKYKIEPPPPPPPDPTPTRTPEVIKFVPPVAVPELPTLALAPIPLPIDKPQLLPLPRPVPVPKFVPAGPKPRNDPGLWVTTNDYPTRDIRERNEGTSRFLLSIDARGKVQNCDIVRSSGHSGLDAATCKTVSRRARFKSASDAAGERVAGTYSGTVRWVIPED